MRVLPDDLPPIDLIAALETAEEGWALARAVRAGGRIVDFDLLLVNESATRILGRGRDLFRLLDEAALAEVVEERKPITRSVKHREKNLDIRVHPLGDGIAATFAVAEDAELAALRSIAADLQHALLPAKLPQIPGVRHATRYLPWTSGADVGGDWFDVIELGRDALAVVIGDVAGHSTTAAATMGQLRAALQAYALDGHSPVAVMNRVNRLLSHIEPEAIATCCYVELHLAEAPATVVLAGHLPPILRHAGAARPVDVRLGPPLGVVADTEYLDTTVLMPPGSTLLLYTDGLVEDHRVSIDQGLAELCAALMALPSTDPATIVDHVLASDIGPRPRRDDVALLAIGVNEGLISRQRDEVQAVRVFHGAASSAPMARRFVGDILAAWGLGDLVDTARLLLGEVISNAVQHTVGDVSVRLRLRINRLRIEVIDGSDRRPDLLDAEPDSESGRGLKIVATLADEWGHDAREAGGKVVWFELAI
jgi:anti-sigma regulatory factor (Ser/Thr protein kinase)